MTPLWRRRGKRTGSAAGQPARIAVGPDATETFFELSGDLFCIAGFDGYFRRLNPSWETVFGYSRTELLSRPLFDFIHPDDRASSARAAAALVKGRETTSFENRYRCADGSYRWLLWNARARPGEKLVYAAARDITARKAERQRVDELNAALRNRTAQLEAVNRELEAFSYSVSHDLRAPLRAIAGFSQILQDDQGDLLDESGREALRRIRAAARRMGTLIDGLLTLARLTRVELKHEPCDLAAMGRGIVSELARQGSAARDVAVSIPDGLSATGDCTLLRIALENLLHNAWKYTSRTPLPRIEMGVLGEAAMPVFFVRDNGAGFDMRYASRLFRAFQRLHSDQDFEGSGIGLATVQRIIQRHGGRVWAEAAIGKGATFYFTLNGGSPS